MATFTLEETPALSRAHGGSCNAQRHGSILRLLLHTAPAGPAVQSDQNATRAAGSGGSRVLANVRGFLFGSVSLAKRKPPNRLIDPVPEWRNWQTRWTQNPVRLKPRVGSIPTSGTSLRSKRSESARLSRRSRPRTAAAQADAPLSSRFETTAWQASHESVYRLHPGERA